MPHDDELYKIVGNIGADERPLMVLHVREGENIVVSNDNRRFAIFIKRFCGANTHSFELKDSPNLFIGFGADEGTEIIKLKLVPDVMCWEVSLLIDLTASEIHADVDDIKNCWEILSDDTESTINLSTNLSAPRPAKQKWKFVRVKTVDE